MPTKIHQKNECLKTTNADKQKDKKTRYTLDSFWQSLRCWKQLSVDGQSFYQQP